MRRSVSARNVDAERLGELAAPCPASAGNVDAIVEGEAVELFVKSRGEVRGRRISARWPARTGPFPGSRTPRRTMARRATSWRRTGRPPAPRPSARCWRRGFRRRRAARLSSPPPDRWSACPLASSAQPGGNFAAFLGRLADADEGGGARRLVDDQRRPARHGRGEGHRIGAIDRLGRAGAGQQRPGRWSRRRTPGPRPPAAR